MDEQEKPPRNDLVIAGPTLDPPPPPHDDDDDPKPSPKPHNKKKKKKRGAMYFIKIALFMIKGTSGKSRGFSTSSSKSLWSKLMYSVRPLHLQLQQPPEPEAKSSALTHHHSPARTEFSDDSMFSPGAGSFRPSETTTPYSSAVGLNEMVQNEEDEEEEETEAVGEGDDGEGDEMIDAKAEEFIANFYNEMSLQRRHSINERSLR